VIGVGYYFKILHAMYFKPPVSEGPIAITMPYRLVLGVTSFVTLFLGLAPEVAFARAERLANKPVTVSVTPSTPQP